MSLLWRTAAISEEQHAALSMVRSLPSPEGRPDSIEGETLKNLLGEHHIVLHDKSDDPSFGPVEHDVNFEDDHQSHPPTELLHTSQPTMQKSSLEHYLRTDHTKILKADGNGFHAPASPDDAYLPVTYSHGDHWTADHWIDDGHHRILANRMLGKSVLAESGWTHGCACPTAKHV